MKEYRNFKKDEIIKRLLAVDVKVYNTYQLPHKIKMCIAGSVCSIFYIHDYRFTDDIDIIQTNYKINEELLNEFDLNTDVQHIADMNIPFTFMERIKYIPLPTLAVDYYLISLEDYVIMKLMAYREKDKFDINKESLANQIDWNLMDVLVSEMNEIFLNERIKYEFLQIYEDYKERWKYAK